MRVGVFLLSIFSTVSVTLYSVYNCFLENYWLSSDKYISQESFFLGSVSLLRREVESMCSSFVNVYVVRKKN